MFAYFCTIYLHCLRDQFYYNGLYMKFKTKIITLLRYDAVYISRCFKGIYCLRHHGFLCSKFLNTLAINVLSFEYNTASVIDK